MRKWGWVAKAGGPTKDGDGAPWRYGEALKHRLSLPGWYVAGGERAAMSDKPPPSIVTRALASKIVAAYVRRNEIGADQMPALVATVYRALVDLRAAAPEAATERMPAVPIRRSVQRDRVTCLECGWTGQTMRRHLSAAHGLSADGYRARWKLPREHPMVAPAYAERRSGLAKEHGLGRARHVALVEASELAAPETSTAAQPRRRGRPRSTPIPV
jgi:predicted transcriptional regulator